MATTSAPEAGSFEVIVKKREGDFAGRPDNGHVHDRNSIPKIEGMKPVVFCRNIPFNPNTNVNQIGN